MNVMKFASIASGVIFGAYGVFLLVWLWGESITWETFTKTTITAGVLIVVIMGLALLYREYIEEKGMKEDKYLD